MRLNSPETRIARASSAASLAFIAALLLAGCGDGASQSPLTPDTNVPTSTTEETADEDDTMTVSPNPNNTESTTDSPTPTPSETMSATPTP